MTESSRNLKQAACGVERVTELSEPPVVGRWYLVPTVRFGYQSDVARDWPVFLPKHEDARFFSFEHVHYHPDPRFIAKALWALAGDEDYNGGIGAFQRLPISRKRWGQWAIDPPAAVWRRRRCHRSHAPYQFGHTPQVGGLREHFAGTRCKSNRHGWVCPHQNWPMGSLEPDADGVITCPLHGLRVRAADGLVLPSDRTATGGSGSTSAPHDSTRGPIPLPTDRKN